MAEAKYELYTKPPMLSDKKIQPQPWYRERLRTKYMKSTKKNEPSKIFNGKNWTFVKDGLDDFRDGLPPPLDSGIMIKGSKGPSPNIQGSSESMTVKQPIVKNRFSKHEICYSRCTPLQQQRRDHIDEIEFGLMQHPLALYPHLEECMPPDVFEDVVDILDPEMNLASDDDEEDDEQDEFNEELEETERQQPSPVTIDKFQTEEEFEKEDMDNNKNRNPYRWLPRKDEKDKKDRKKAVEKRTHSPSQNEHIKQVTKDFCDWVSSLGGESNNIEESTITSLFASGYETKPALSVPIHVVELTNVPPELRMSATVPQQSQTKNIPQQNKEEKEWMYSGSYEPSWIKFKYGAWYLPVPMWKKRDAEEPLQDPQELKNQEMSDAKKKSNALDAELAPMHGAKSFMEFIDKKNTRRPEFLDRVSDFQQQAEEEERLKQEAEAAKQKKQKNPQLRSKRQSKFAT
ncbi:protein FAM47E-like [Tubulanus polymorphus]|uniref:protein FAM47E-like n=1 Tax=Tubulanus polymorphus TaxID=672921 RepID=UPI003DA46DBE